MVALAFGLVACTGSAPAQERASTTTRAVTQSPAPAVVVRTDRTSYPAGIRPVIVIRNGLRRAITTTTGQTECTIVALDRRRGTVWKEVRNCYSGEPPRTVRIAAGAIVRIRLAERLEPGTYRARLEYSVRGKQARALSAPMRVA